MCSPGSHLVQESSARHRKSNLCSDILHTQEKDGCFPDSFLTEEWGGRLPSQTGQPHALVAGWEQRGGGHEVLEHRTEPLCRR